ncbi:MAG: KOW domain-containing RNA-binding protein [Clostridia bacterium]|nr:KOW domain-containing RNA-binding protein [Clostridia bacterium]
MKVKNPEEGGVVISLQGHDEGNFYVIVEVRGDRVLVADGVKRRLENPKKKSVKHIRLLPRNISEAGIVRDKSFDVRTARYLKELAEKVKSEDVSFV